MLAIAGGKGGAGKTTSTLGLADALPGRPLVVDADRAMPDLHALAGVPREPTLAEAGRNPAEEASVPPDLDCRVLGAPGPDDSATDGLLHSVGAALSASGNAADSSGRPRCLVDCPSGVSPGAVAPLRVADAVVLVSPLCAPGLRATAKTAAMARALDTAVEGVVLTRTTLRPARVSDLLGCPVLGAIPEVTPPVLAARAVREAYGTVAAGLETARERQTPV